jgi:hypothetical protein
VIRVALLCVALSGCTVIDHIQILPVVNPQTYDPSCCIAYWELSRSTTGSIEVQKGARSWSISSKFHSTF